MTEIICEVNRMFRDAKIMAVQEEPGQAGSVVIGAGS